MNKGDKIRIKGESGVFTIKKIYYPRFYTVEHGNDYQWHVDDIEQTLSSKIEHICSSCGKSTLKDGFGITDKNKYYCVSCWELITGKKANGRCLN